MPNPLHDRIDRWFAASKKKRTVQQVGFAALGIRTVDDLLRRPPRRYVLLNELTNIARLPIGEEATVAVEVVESSVRRMTTRRGTIAEVVVSDGVDRLRLAFFEQPWRVTQLRPGRRLVLTGKVGAYRGERQLTHPQVEVVDVSEDDSEDDSGEDAAPPPLAEPTTGRTIPFPVYGLARDLMQGDVRKLVRTILGTLVDVPDPIPPDVRDRHDLVDLHAAFELVHRPATDADHVRGLHRLQWEEAFVLQVELARRRTAARSVPGRPRRRRAGGLVDQLEAALPFQLTEGQQAVGAEIATDLAEETPMHRLLQGEVGSGKTLVAVRAMLTVVDSGGQAALLAPTEVLAQQHYRSLVDLLGPLADGGRLGASDDATDVVLLTGSLPAAARRERLGRIESGAAGIVVGTHALLQQGVEFADLGLVVVDEQHRFGVEQRDALRLKGVAPPHVLVMTATPIPRTVAMTVFGDLDVSTLAELPAGRAGVDTYLVPTEKPRFVARVWERVREEVARGHQAFVVCPLIGADDAEPESEALAPDDIEPATSVLDLAPKLESGPLKGLRLAVLHGRMTSDAKDDVMRRFAVGAIDVLVATTVVEVGVDVPNATTMVIMDAHRFGVSQLHQLRGRVARGSARGVCLLVTSTSDESTAWARLAEVAATTDGFELARVDLEQRREGDVLGALQSGRSSTLRLLRVTEHEQIVLAARSEATSLVAADPGLDQHPDLVDAIDRYLADDTAEFLERG